MYSRMLIPLDESIIAEQVLPYARYLAEAPAIPVELLEVVDFRGPQATSQSRAGSIHRHRFS